MGAIEDQVQHLHDVVARLEGRIKDLEVKHLGGASAPKTIDEIRMILIGPPGAGTTPPEVLEKVARSSDEAWQRVCEKLRIGSTES